MLNFFKKNTAVEKSLEEDYFNRINSFIPELKVSDKVGNYSYEDICYVVSSNKLNFIKSAEIFLEDALFKYVFSDKNKSPNFFDAIPSFFKDKYPEKYASMVKRLLSKQISLDIEKMNSVQSQPTATNALLKRREELFQHIKKNKDNNSIDLTSFSDSPYLTMFGQLEYARVNNNKEYSLNRLFDELSLSRHT